LPLCRTALAGVIVGDESVGALYRQHFHDSGNAVGHRCRLGRFFQPYRGGPLLENLE